MTPIRLGFIGLGHITLNAHLPALTPLAVINPAVALLFEGLSFLVIARVLRWPARRAGRSRRPGRQPVRRVARGANVGRDPAYLWAGIGTWRKGLFSRGHAEQSRLGRVFVC